MSRDDVPLVELSDGALLVLSGSDSAAFGEFYDRHIADVLRFFYRRTLCAETAADLAAETFAAAYASRRRFRDVGAPARAWLFKIAQRRLARAARGRAIEMKYRRRLGISRSEVDDESLERIEALVDLDPLRGALADAFGSLASTQADAVRLRVVEGLPFRDVAERLGCTEVAARVRVSRAMTQLATRLEVAL